MKQLTEAQKQAFDAGRALGPVSRTLEPGQTRKQVQFSMSSGDLERLEAFMESEGLPQRSEALRVLLTPAGF